MAPGSPPLPIRALTGLGEEPPPGFDLCGREALASCCGRLVDRASLDFVVLGEAEHESGGMVVLFRSLPQVPRGVEGDVIVIALAPR